MGHAGACCAILIAASLHAETIPVPGLHKPVEILRDRWGVPHIYARTAHDVFFAQGYVAAQDRLFQMEIWRRAGEGRLAEVLGPSYVTRDRLARLFKYRGDSAAEWSSYAPDARALVAAFVSGVNAYIDEVRAHRNKLPIEFSLLDFLPERWTPEVPLTRVTSLSGVGNGTSELLRARLVALVGAETMAVQLFTELLLGLVALLRRLHGALVRRGPCRERPPGPREAGLCGRSPSVESMCGREERWT